MKPITIAILAASAFALSACGGGDEADAPPKSQAAGLKDLDVSKAVMADGRKADRDTLRTRRINGLWHGKAGPDDVQADFGSDGTLSLAIMRNGSMSDQARGTWRWNDDNTISGGIEGGRGQLAGFSTWSGGFKGTGTMLVTGSSGSITLERRRGAPIAPAGGSSVITAEMLGAASGEAK